MQQVGCNILRRMAIDSQGAPGFNYTVFKNRLFTEGFTDKQNVPLRLRLNLLESFMDRSAYEGSQTHVMKPKADIWTFQPGSLTIVDLSCPFIDSDAACMLFNISLSLFLEDRSNISRIVALDEAHKVRFSHLHHSHRFLRFSRLTKTNTT